ncbi:DUF4331 domain-containing protein [Salegentibacter sp. JZCK2]|uniref:DUF4331 family protein n=1 Tax=Salegentibacter tibetensis TaxID=2873600 RepID=UPI001CCA0598|nr:DUF4331 family protein [Salegentibacter tibetensis]MBZ9729046.1 DUF4331 domain-containing protein [Salegentibacter tibetensis]
MKKIKIFACLGLILAASIFIAADHIDAPGVAGSSADIADFYAFEPTTGSDNTVFIVNVQSNVLPDLTYGEFDEDVLIEINIDLDGDLVEDQVIQAIPRDGIMYFFGPFSPSSTGLNSEVATGNALGSVEISSTTAITTTTDNGVSLFAGPRQDAFYFDFIRFNEVIAPSPSDNSGFNVPGTDTFDGANTLSIALEVPNELLGTPTAQNVIGVPVYKTWVTTNRKQ